MGLSRLVKYLAILKTLECWDSITQKQIIAKTDPNCLVSTEDLEFLIKSDLIREKTMGNRMAYSITHKGQRVSEYFRVKDDNLIFASTRITRID